MTGDLGVSQLKLLKHYKASVLGSNSLELSKQGLIHLKFVTGGTPM